MTDVESRHQRAARRSADGTAAIRLRKFHAIRRQPVDVWRCDQLLTVAANVAVTEVVRQNEDDVRLDGAGPQGQYRRRSSAEERASIHVNQLIRS